VAEQCRSCKASVIWAVSEKGKRIPMDADPVADGNFILEYSAVGEPPVARPRNATIGTVEFRDGLGFKSHFATCPDAGEWRKR
jgi:hypothetical protein